jgi:3-phosphoshikimate 1-carboxyvinyltransferase
MGAVVDERPDGISVHGPAALRGATVDAGGDHRIAMALALAALVGSGPTTIEGADSAAVSYPAFFDDLVELTHG